MKDLYIPHLNELLLHFYMYSVCKMTDDTISFVNPEYENHDRQYQSIFFFINRQFRGNRIIYPNIFSKFTYIYWMNKKLIFRYFHASIHVNSILSLLYYSYVSKCLTLLKNNKYFLMCTHLSLTLIVQPRTLRREEG